MKHPELFLALSLAVACAEGGGPRRDDRDPAPPVAVDTQGDPVTDTNATDPTTRDTSPPATTDTGTPPPPPLELRFRGGAAPSNLLVISVDTLRADALDRLGGTGRMPFLSSLADQGFSLDDTRACAHWTFPATACALAGRSSVDLAKESGFLPVTGWHQPVGEYPEDVPFLPTWLRGAGYYTMLFTANTLLEGARGYTRAFHELYTQHGADAPSLFDVALTRIAAARARGALDGRWYLHLHLFDPHKLYAPPDAYLDEVNQLEPIPYDLETEEGHLAAQEALVDEDVPQDMLDLIKLHFHLRYLAELEYLDDTLEDRWGDLDDAGLLDDTLVVFFADHGEQFFERDTIGHGKTLHAPETRVMSFFWARGLEPGATSRPASATDLVPIVLDTLGHPRPPQVTGYRLQDLPEARTRLALGVSTTGPLASALREPWLIHWGFGDPEGLSNPAMDKEAGVYAYDLAVDPEAHTPVWPDDPALAALWAELQVEVARAEPEVEEIGFEVLWP